MDSVFNANEDVKPVVTSDCILSTAVNLMCDVWHRNEIKEEFSQTELNINVKQEDNCVESLDLPSEVVNLKCDAGKEYNSSVKLELLHEELNIKTEILDTDEEKTAERGENPFECDVKEEDISVESLKLPSEVPDLKCDADSSVKLELLHEEVNIKTEILDTNEEMVEKGGNPFECDMCEYTCKRWSVLEEHLQTHTKPFKCNLCNFQYVHKWQLNRHIKIHTDEKLFECNLCDYKTVRKHNLKSHMSTHNCKLYDFKSSSKIGLNNHMVTHKYVFKCNVCDFKGERRRDLNQHLKIHNNNKKRFVCHICGYKFVRKVELKQHNTLTHRTQKLFKCNLCDYKSRRKPDVNDHALMHVFAFKCKLCDFKCAQKGDLERHVLTHTGN